MFFLFFYFFYFYFFVALFQKTSNGIYQKISKCSKGDRRCHCRCCETESGQTPNVYHSSHPPPPSPLLFCVCCVCVVCVCARACVCDVCIMFGYDSHVVLYRDREDLIGLLLHARDTKTERHLSSDEVSHSLHVARCKYARCEYARVSSACRV